jgi:hypothetical protein
MFEAATAPVRSAPDIEPVREPDAFDALVREIGVDGACEVRAVFWSETPARLKLFRTLSARPVSRQDRARGAFAQERGENVRLSPARGAGAAAGGDRGRARRCRIRRAPGANGLAFAAAREQELARLTTFCAQARRTYTAVRFSQMTNHRWR